MLTLEALEIRQGDFLLKADLTVEQGHRVAIIGPSGGGKSTLLGAIAGFVEVTSGQILWNRHDITNAAPAARPVAMLFQDNNLFPHLTLRQNVGLGIRPNLRLSQAEQQRVDDALSHVGLGGMGGRKPGQVSGGQQGRAALARVLVQDKPLLLLDEPFAALGPALKTEMLDLVSTLAKENGATLIMVTHDPNDARHIADQTILLADGTAHPPAPTKALLETPPAALREYLGL